MFTRPWLVLLATLSSVPFVQVVAMGQSPVPARSASGHVPVGERAGADRSGRSTEYRITGSVVSERDGSPVAHCRLTALKVGAALGLVPATREVPVRDAASPEHVEATPGAVPPQVSAPGSAPRAVPALEANGAMRGRRGGGLRQADEPAPETETDGRGHFSLAVPSAGMWRLTGEARGFRNQALDEHDGFSTAVVVTPIRPVEAVNFRLTPNGIVEGVVLDEAGEAVRQAQVAAFRVQPASVEDRFQQMQQQAFATTDDRGHYEFNNLGPGQYKLSVTGRPWYATPPPRVGPPGSPGSGDAGAGSVPSLDVVYPLTWYPGATEMEAASTVSLRAGEETQADFHLVAVPALHLRIPGAPLEPGATDGRRGLPNQAPQVLAAQNSAFGMSGQITSFENNTWDVGGLAPGRYQVRMPGDGDRLVQVTLGPGGSQTLAGDEASTGTQVTVNLDGPAVEDVRQVSFVDPASGRAYVASNAAGNQRFGRRSNVRLGAASDTPAPASQSADQPPQPRKVTLPPGTYVVYLSGGAGVYLSGVKATGATVTGRAVAIGGGTPLVTVTTGRGVGEVTGLVHRTTDKTRPLDAGAVPGAMVLLIPVSFGQTGSMLFVERDQTNTDGSFVLAGVLPGEYILVAIDHGWSIDWHDPATLAHYLDRGTPIALGGGQKLRRDVETVDP